jgi:hypothetical protein
MTPPEIRENGYWALSRHQFVAKVRFAPQKQTFPRSPFLRHGVHLAFGARRRLDVQNELDA